MGLRAYWRCTNPNPVRSYTIAAWQILAALFLHRLIYIIVISQCVPGVLNPGFAGKASPYSTS
jgi:cytochrome b561